jgi:hypothetical protein
VFGPWLFVERGTMRNCGSSTRVGKDSISVSNLLHKTVSVEQHCAA